MTTPPPLRPRFTTVGPPGDRLLAELDLANLAHVNDAYGHAVGDVLLAVVGARLRHLGTRLRFVDAGGRWLVHGSDGLLVRRDEWDRLVATLTPLVFDPAACARLAGLDRHVQLPASFLRGRATAVPAAMAEAVHDRPVVQVHLAAELDTAAGLVTARLGEAPTPATVAAVRAHLDGLGLHALDRVDERTWSGPAAGWAGPVPLHQAVLRPVAHDVPVAGGATARLSLESWPLPPERSS